MRVLVRQVLGLAPASSASVERAASSRASCVATAAEAAAEQEQMKLIVGSAANVLIVTGMLRHEHQLDILAALEQVGLSKLGYFHTPGDPLFTALNKSAQEHRADTACQEKAGEEFATPTCFQNIHLTRTDVIAPWLTLESIGAASELAGRTANGRHDEHGFRRQA